MRRAISLLEVLFAVFILSVGLLGAFLLLAIGGRQAQESLAMSSAVTLGNRGLAAYSNRDLANPVHLIRMPAGGWPANWIPAFHPFPFENASQPIGAYVFDPLGYAIAYQRSSGGESVPNMRSFPSAGAVSVPRYTLDSAMYRGIGNGSPRQDVSTMLAMSDLLCRGRDDIVFYPPVNDPTGRPQIEPVSEGKYSWLAFVKPNPAENTPGAAVVNRQKRESRVSIVVIERRGLVEQQYPCRVHSGANFIELNQTAGIKPGSWVMLSVQPLPRQGVVAGYSHHWYRVVAAPERGVGAGRVTLLNARGPDLPIDLAAVANGPVPGYVTVVPGVIDVMERVIGR